MVSYSIKSVDFNCLLLKSPLKLSLQQQPFSLNEEAMVVEETSMAVVGLIVAEMVVVVVAVEGTLTLMEEALQGKRLLKISRDLQIGAALHKGKTKDGLYVWADEDNKESKRTLLVQHSKSLPANF
ncbi:hypothetical protein EJ110_NYTH18302 [Nymphaea thermarum]|nr:hypothetical protein EJ110_NYTH18302 [Nymphaea thermarum]